MKNPPKIAIDVKNLQAAQLLRDAADVLVKEGWRTRSIGYIGLPKCALGAINAALTRTTTDYTVHGFTDPVWNLAVHALAKSTGLDRTSVNACIVAEWNNVQTDGQAVINKMREVADSLDLA